MKVLALVLARGGSQRIPMKNLRKLDGHPLIWYTIKEAKKSRHINRIIVSTDDERIASAAKDFGAQAPFLRPAEISRADSTELEAFEHALSWLRENEGYEPDLIVKLFPTSPFRTVKRIDEAIQLKIANPQADSVRTVRLCKEHPYKMWELKDGLLAPFIPWEDKPENAHTLSYQVLPKVYVNNASIDVTTPETIRKTRSVTGKRIVFLVMDEIESVDINDELDFLLAETILDKGLWNFSQER